MRAFGVIVLSCAAAFAARSQGAAPPSRCEADPMHRQFDFWLGHWDVFTPDGKKAGENRIELADGACVLIERWRGSGGFTGTSLNSWSAKTRQWHQHWVDNQGGMLRLAGGLDGQRMVLSSIEPRAGKPGASLRQRITWTPLPDGAVRQLWETSEDDGATWTTAFDGRYVKAK